MSKIPKFVIGEEICFITLENNYFVNYGTIVSITCVGTSVSLIRTEIDNFYDIRVDYKAGGYYEICERIPEKYVFKNFNEAYEYYKKHLEKKLPEQEINLFELTCKVITYIKDNSGVNVDYKKVAVEVARKIMERYDARI